ncbi:MAG TPA: TrbC/VirB2 family protein [Gammaproteobacteria bacterium]|nr:TrbC/VirB2 family protein [Gammaproteobacteria bacterium]
MKNIYREKLVALLSLLFLSCPAFAMGETPVSDGLGYLITAMYGATGAAFATLSIMVVGLLCLGHVLRWSALGYTIAGISIIYGAGVIVRGITMLIHV